jgi:hypothetical protein
MGDSPFFNKAILPHLIHMFCLYYSTLQCRNQGLLITPFAINNTSPLLTLCFLFAVCWVASFSCCHDGLPYQQIQGQGLCTETLRLWAKINLPPCKLFSKVFWSKLSKSNQCRYKEQNSSPGLQSLMLISQCKIHLVLSRSLHILYNSSMAQKSGTQSSFWLWVTVKKVTYSRIQW